MAREREADIAFFRKRDQQLRRAAIAAAVTEVFQRERAKLAQTRAAVERHKDGDQ
jgi:phenylpyruvate tautomerase PptA (4-oxalocrotonate tautomerase family)